MTIIFCNKENAKYVRFVYTDGVKHWRKHNPVYLTGLITLAGVLELDRKVDQLRRKKINSILEWYNDEIPCPPFRKNRKVWGKDACCSWKSDAVDAIRMMKRLARIIRSLGFCVRTLYLENVGRHLYRDDFQVVSRWA